MATLAEKEEIVAGLERTVGECLAFFEGPGQRSTVRIDRWGARDVLAHFIYWHYATAWGINGAARGGPAWQLPATGDPAQMADRVNANALALHEGESFADLVAQLRRAQQRLVQAARSCGDWDAPAFRRADASETSVEQRLRTITHHWQTHVEDLKKAG